LVVAVLGGCAVDGHGFAVGVLVGVGVGSSAGAAGGCEVVGIGVAGDIGGRQAAGLVVGVGFGLA